MTQQKTNQVKTRRKKVIVVVAVLVALLLVDTAITGFLKFGYYMLKCGGMPVMLESGAFAGNRVYILLGHYSQV